MKGFFIKLALFITALIGSYGFLVNKLSESYVDKYYNKFTQKAGGLIIGISKASKGINPTIIENELQSINYDTPIVNFALNVNNSQYGDVYFESIQKKLKKKSKKQLFILSVSPANFTAPYNMNAEDIIDLDKKTIVGQVDIVDAKPNYNYIINTYSMPLYNALHEHEKRDYYSLHENGWLEIKLKYSQDSIKNIDKAFLKLNLMKYFKKNINSREISKYRIECFIKIINFLKTKGDVFIIRIPEDKEFMKFENDFWPNFVTKMNSISTTYNVPFFDYSNLADKFTTYDGLHFESNGAKEFTKMLSKDVLLYLKNKP